MQHGPWQTPFSRLVPPPAGLAPWRLHLDRGTLVDVLDTRSIWCEAEVAEADPDDDMVMIHFLYWSSAWDELLPRSSPRIAQHGSRACTAAPPSAALGMRCVYLTLTYHTLADVKNGTLRAGQRIEVFDEHPAKRVFMEASVLSVTATHVRVHFIVRPGGTHRTASAFRRLPCSCRTRACCVWWLLIFARRGGPLAGMKTFL